MNHIKNWMPLYAPEASRRITERACDTLWNLVAHKFMMSMREVA